jgi:hypothetical protein
VRPGSGTAERAAYFAERCIRVSEDSNLAPFYVGYAYEALARARRAAGDRAGAAALLEEWRSVATRIEDAEERSMLLGDLETVVKS